MKILIHLIAFLCVSNLFAQSSKFENRIQEFEKLDSVKMPPQGANLFVGSSSIALWESIETDYKDFKVINRGFGGSGLLDLVHFASRIITNYNPSKVFIYSGENDLGEGATAMQTAEMFKKVFETIRKLSPNLPILFISIKPSYSRLHQFQIQNEANQLIKTYIKTQKKAEFVNVVNLMLVEGKPDSTLFIADKLHMNAKGYQIWTKKLKKFLIE